ncbi:MAG: RnfABCDGE type electron transport complex subunit D [Lachnospiraceae bacterium]|nr:RnfABCDGE type electron transport complex subunit D [Lachnospiraceae bacterium]
MNEMYNVSTSPHMLCNRSTKTIMRDVVIGLLPATFFGIYNFGIRALVIILACVASAVLSEYLFQKGMHKKITVGDYSAIITGLLLALNLPVSLPIWMAVLGSVFAIIVVKQLFGGLGQNFMNPALGARCFLVISFAGRMTSFAVEKTGSIINGRMAVDGVSGATPLTALKAGESVDVMKMFIGTTGGTIGETSALAILIGGLYLVIRKVISPKIPCIYIGTVAVFTAIYSACSQNGFDFNFVLAHICGGGLMLGAVFMATDYVTCPITPMGKVVFALLLGIFTSIFRLFGGSAEGVSYAIIFCNLLVPLIEKVTIPTAFGKGGNNNGSR